MPLERLGPFVYQRYQPHLPPVDGGQESQLHDVLIAGGGPVGLSTALGLALRGVRSVIIEADDSVCEGSRAACTSRRSLEILDRLGVSRTFLGKGLPWTTGRSYYREREVLVFSMPHDETQKFPPMINLEQYYIEQFLLDEIARVNAAAADGKPLVEMRWASKVTAFTQDAQGVRLTVENALGHYETRGRWLVASNPNHPNTTATHRLIENGEVVYAGKHIIFVGRGYSAPVDEVRVDEELQRHQTPDRHTVAPVGEVGCQDGKDHQPGGSPVLVVHANHPVDGVLRWRGSHGRVIRAGSSPL